MPPIIVHDMETLQKTVSELVQAGQSIALVPTMGALHEGHISLVRTALEYADSVIVSIFVNPRQFGKNEDFSRYPRTLEADVAKLAEAGVAVVYAPTAEDMYPAGFSTSVTVGALSTMLCGAFRPGHFDGVATVVSKLLLRVLPHVAVFGEKDYQQLCVIRRVVDDLDIAVDIVGAPTVREADGLAMSSRNTYLSAQERTTAAKIYSVLGQTSRKIVGGTAVAEAIADGLVQLDQAGFKVDYLSLRHGETLEPMNEYAAPARLLVAAWLGNTRLIDNIAVE